MDFPAIGFVFVLFLVLICYVLGYGHGRRDGFRQAHEQLWEVQYAIRDGIVKMESIRKVPLPSYLPMPIIRKTKLVSEMSDTELLRALDACFCDDTGNQPECDNCKVLRQEIQTRAKVRELNTWYMSPIHRDHPKPPKPNDVVFPPDNQTEM